MIAQGANIVGSIVNYFDEKERRHQEWLKERPDMVDLSNSGVEVELKPGKGYLEPDGGFGPPGYEVDVKEIEDSDDDDGDGESGGPAFSYPMGVGPMLMNGCFGTGYLTTCLLYTSPSPRDS